VSDGDSSAGKEDLALDEIEFQPLSDHARKMRPTRGRYKKLLKDYAAQLGYDSDKSMKRWVKEGGQQDPPDFPPFDDLSQMAAWWRRLKPRRKVPEELLKFENQPPAGASSEPSLPGESKDSPPPSPPGTAMQLVSGVAMPAELVVQTLRDVFAARFDQWKRAVETNDPNADSLERKLNEIAGRLRAWEKDLTGIQRDKGEVLDVARTNIETVQMWGVMAQSFINAMLELAQRLAPTLPPSERRSIVIPLKDKCFAHLKKTRYAKVYEAFSLESAAAEVA
jgi:hypothetical protein